MVLDDAPDEVGGHARVGIENDEKPCVADRLGRNLAQRVALGSMKAVSANDQAVQACASDRLAHDDAGPVERAVVDYDDSKAHATCHAAEVLPPKVPSSAAMCVSSSRAGMRTAMAGVSRAGAVV